MIDSKASEPLPYELMSYELRVSEKKGLVEKG